MTIWQEGWNALWSTFNKLDESDAERDHYHPRRTSHCAAAALRSVTHTAYHVGQILYLARLLRPERKWLTIAPGQSQSWKSPYLPTPEKT